MPPLMLRRAICHVPPLMLRRAICSRHHGIGRPHSCSVVLFGLRSRLISVTSLCNITIAALMTSMSLCIAAEELAARAAEELAARAAEELASAGGGGGGDGIVCALEGVATPWVTVLCFHKTVPGLFSLHTGSTFFHATSVPWYRAMSSVHPTEHGGQ